MGWIGAIFGFLKGIGGMLVGMFNEAQKTEGVTHEVKENSTGLDDGKSAVDIANEYRMHDRDQEED